MYPWYMLDLILYLCNLHILFNVSESVFPVRFCFRTSLGLHNYPFSESGFSSIACLLTFSFFVLFWGAILSPLFLSGKHRLRFLKATVKSHLTASECPVDACMLSWHGHVKLASLMLNGCHKPFKRHAA